MLVGRTSGVRRLNACRLQLGGADLIVEQGHRDTIFQIVVGLLFGLRVVLRTIATASREIEGPLEDIAAHALHIRCHHNVAALQIKHCFQHRSASQACFGSGRKEPSNRSDEP